MVKVMKNWRRGQTVDKSISIAREIFYRAFPVEMGDTILGGSYPWRVAQAMSDGKEVPKTTLCRCQSEQEANYISHSLTLTVAVVALAKPLVLDTMER